MSLSLDELDAEVGAMLPARDTMSIFGSFNNYLNIYASDTAVATTINSSQTSTYALAGSFIFVNQTA
jgi:hypothetical protein